MEMRMKSGKFEGLYRQCQLKFSEFFYHRFLWLQDIGDANILAWVSAGQVFFRVTNNPFPGVPCICALNKTAI